jgi:site-specific DNA-adenine methylase
VIFRFPGGKGKSIHVLDPFLERLVDRRRAFTDVFVGGGGVLLHVARKYPRLALRANDLDPDIAAFLEDRRRKGSVRALRSVPHPANH